MRMIKSVFVSVVMTAVCACGEGTSFQYVGANGGDWNVAANWQPAGLPGAEDSVLVSNKSVKCSGVASVKDLTVFWGEFAADGLDVSGDISLVCGALATVGTGTNDSERAHVGGNAVLKGSSRLMLRVPSFEVGGELVLKDSASVKPLKNKIVKLSVGGKVSELSSVMAVGNGGNELDSMYPAGVAFSGVPTAHWRQRFYEKTALSAKSGKNAKVIFLGDSITHFWESWNSGLPVMGKYFAKEPYNALFYGHAGDRTQQLLWRIENGELEGCDPQVIVLMIGTNNNLGVGDEKCEVALGVVTVVETLRRKFPKARIILHPIFPAIEKEKDYARAMSNLINRELRKLCDGVHIIWCDFNSKFLAEDGSIPKTMMSDFVHPTTAGYEIWAEELKPVLDRALAAKPGEKIGGLEDSAFPRWTGFEPTFAAAMPDGRFGLDDNSAKMNDWALSIMGHRLAVRALRRGTKFEKVYLGDGEAVHMGDAEMIKTMTNGISNSAINCGFIGDKTQNVLWRIHMGELNGFFANDIYLAVGNENLAAGERADEVFAGIKACVLELRRMQRYARIHIAPVFGNTTEVKKVNQMLLEEKWEGPVNVIDP